MLEKVKQMLGITGTYQDSAIQGYIDEVKQYLINGGVSKTIVDDSSSIGLIARGVSDLWNYGSGGTSLSPYFIERAIQLSYKSEEELTATTTDSSTTEDTETTDTTTEENNTTESTDETEGDSNE